MTERFELAVVGGTIVTPRGRARANVHVRDGRVVHVGADRHDADRTFDASGLLVLPGMVDTHVHLMDPGDPTREDFPTGTAAAAARGVTTIVEHTHAHPVRTVGELDAKRAHLRGRARVDYGLAAHVWPDRIGELAALWRAGITYFKAFTCTTHGVPGLTPADLRAAMTALASFGGACLVHGEDESITAAAERDLRAEGWHDGSLLPRWRSREAELVAVQTVCLLARLTGARVTVAHASGPDVAEVVRRARLDGADVVAEACPQYLLLREDEVLEHGALRKFTPPARARSDADQAEMWRLLRTGAFHHLSTDHAPATREQKESGGFWDVHFGLPGLDTTLPLMLDAAAAGLLSVEDVVRLYAEAPARRYGLHPRKGTIEPGGDADLALVDPETSWTLTDDLVISRAGWTPYAGRAVRGRVVATFLRGRQVAEDGRPTEELPGRFLPGPGHQEVSDDDDR